MAGETPKLWSKLESAGDVTSPQLGTGGAEVGSPTYPAAKFGNGILSDINSEGCTFPTAGNNINVDKGTIEFWAKLNFNPTDPDYRYLFDFCDYANGGIRFYFNVNTDDFDVVVMSGGATVASVHTTGLSWSSGDIKHFAIAWDREGNDIGNSKTLILKIDDVEIDSTTTTWNTDTVNANLYIGMRSSDGLHHSDTVVDNLKTYDVCKTDFSGRGYEGIEETFGKTIKGEEGRYGTGGNAICACKFTSGSAGTLASISAYLQYFGGNSLVKCAIYDSSLNPVANGTTEQKLVESEQDGWMTFNFNTPPSVAATTVYWLCMWLELTTYFWEDAGSTDQFFTRTITYNGWPSPLPIGTRFDWESSIYAIYGEAPPPAVKTLVQATLISIPPLIVLPTLAQILKLTGGC